MAGQDPIPSVAPTPCEDRHWPRLTVGHACRTRLVFASGTRLSGPSSGQSTGGPAGSTPNSSSTIRAAKRGAMRPNSSRRGCQSSRRPGGEGPGATLLLPFACVELRTIRDADEARPHDHERPKPRTARLVVTQPPAYEADLQHGVHRVRRRGRRHRGALNASLRPLCQPDCPMRGPELDRAEHFPHEGVRQRLVAQDLAQVFPCLLFCGGRAQDRPGDATGDDARRHEDDPRRRK